MFNKLLPLVTLGVFFSFSAGFAQSETDALRLSTINPSATARSIGLGGTGASYGGDFSAIAINPAGVGIYRHSKVMITPVLRLNGMRSNYLNHNDADRETKFGLNNLGVVFAKDGAYEASPWKTFSIGIGYNRMADFNNSLTYSGSNNQSSLTDIMSQDAINSGMGEEMVPPLGFLGYQGFLLYDDFTSIPHHTILDAGGSLLQTKTLQSSGGVDNWTLSFGGNYKEKVIIGASVDLVSYKYKHDSYFDEQDETGNPDNDFDFLSYHEFLSTSGIGFNLKLGAIYIPTEALRFGFAFHTPTWSSFTEHSDYDVLTNTENLKGRTGQSSSDPNSFAQPGQDYVFDYALRTPWRLVLSGTAFLGQNGFITLDYTYVDYASMKYNFGPGFRDYELDVNRAIKDTYLGSHNVNFGIEGRLDNAMGRLGFAYHSSPFKRSIDFGGQSFDLTAGFGLKFDAFSMDLGYRHTIYKSAEYAYPLLISGVTTGIAKMTQNNNLVALTLGLQF